MCSVLHPYILLCMVLRFQLGLHSQLPTSCCVGSCQKIYIVVLGVDLSFAVDKINVLWF